MMALAIVLTCVLGAGLAGWYYGKECGFREGAPFGSLCRRTLDEDWFSDVLGATVKTDLNTRRRGAGKPSATITEKDATG